MSTDDAVLTITGGEAIARMLAKFDVGPIFGMGGFQLLPFYDAAGRLGLLHHLVNDERAGVFMADSYAKMSGKVGIVDATLGPGATNLVTGLVEALNAGTPLVAIIGDTHRDYSGKNMTQESRQADILRPAAKELITIPTPQRIPELVRRAFTIATSGRPGPVVLNVPEDVSHGICSFDNRQFYADPVYRRVPALRIRPDRSSLQTAAEMICRASRPLLVAGGGAHISDAGSVLTTFVETLNIPVAHTMTGKGAIACTNSLNAGPFGRYDRFANELVASADLLIAVGCKLGEIATKRYTVAPDNGRVIQIDIVAEEIGRTLHPDLGLWGDVRETISGLLDAIGGRGPILRAQLAPYAKEVAELMTAWRESISDRLTTDETPISMARLMNEINLLLPAEGVLVTDGGFAAHWAGLLFDTKQAGRGLVTDRGFASIGYGLPGAIGASLAAPGRPVVSLTGDGGFNMMLGELETARRLKVSPTIVVLNNAASGYVKALQHFIYGENRYYASDLSETNYADVANAFGCKGIRIEHPGQLKNALRDAIASQTLTVLDVVITRDPARMLPGVDSRTVSVTPGDRIA